MIKTEGKLYLLLFVSVTMGCFLTGGCDKKNRPAPVEPEWGIVAHFGMVTTVWISDRSLGDKFHVAQILQVLDRKHSNGIVWFFDSEQHAARRAPMTDEQMLHFVGQYDPLQSKTFRYVKISNPDANMEIIETTIHPGHVE